MNADRWNSLYCESNFLSLKDLYRCYGIFIEIFETTYMYIKASYFVQSVSVENISVRLFFLLIESTISCTILTFVSRQERYKIHSLSREHRLWLNKPDSLYTRKYIALILVPSTMHFDLNSLLQIRNSRQERFYMPVSSAETWKVSLGFNEDTG